MRREFGGTSTSPPSTTCTEDADASVSSPSRSRMVSWASASTASWRSSTFASSAVDLMSQRAQRVSVAVTQLTPRSSSAGGLGASGAPKANTVRSIRGSGAWLRPYSAPRVTCQYTYCSPPPLRSMSAPRIARHCSRVCGSSMLMPARLRPSRSRCAPKRNGRPPYTGITSYTPSAYRKPRSSGEMRASRSGRKAPFR